MKSERLRIFLPVFIIAVVVIIAILTFRRVQLQRLQEAAVEHAMTLKMESLDTNFSTHRISIRGSDAFRLQVARSLVLIRVTDPEAFRRVTNAFGIIQEAHRTACGYSNQPPTMWFHPKTAARSLIYCAEAIAHETRHLEILRFRLRDMSPKASYGDESHELSSYEQAREDELAAIEFQIHVARRVGASRSEIRRLKRLDGTHFDINRDGKFDDEDCKLQNW
jgi:hypothetical protein